MVPCWSAPPRTVVPPAQLCRASRNTERHHESPYHRRRRRRRRRHPGKLQPGQEPKRFPSHGSVARKGTTASPDLLVHGGDRDAKSTSRVTGNTKDPVFASARRDAERRLPAARRRRRAPASTVLTRVARRGRHPDGEGDAAAQGSVFANDVAALHERGRLRLHVRSTSRRRSSPAGCSRCGANGAHGFHSRAHPDGTAPSRRRRSLAGRRADAVLRRAAR